MLAVLLNRSSSGSGSYFGKVLVLVLAPVPVPAPEQKCFYNILTFQYLFNVRSNLFPIKLASNLWFFYFCITFYVGPGHNPERFTVPVPQRQRVAEIFFCFKLVQWIIEKVISKLIIIKQAFLTQHCARVWCLHSKLI
jgi:hypothetical protein